MSLQRLDRCFDLMRILLLEASWYHYWDLWPSHCEYSLIANASTKWAASSRWWPTTLQAVSHQQSFEACHGSCCCARTRVSTLDFAGSEFHPSSCCKCCLRKIPYCSVWAELASTAQSWAPFDSASDWLTASCLCVGRQMGQCCALRFLSLRPLCSLLCSWSEKTSSP